MYKNRAKEWCPKDSCPTRQAWEKQRDIFSLSKAKRDFCRCWSEAQESKNPLLEFVQETQSKAMTQMCRPAAVALPSRLSPPSLWGGRGGKTNHGAEFQGHRATGLTRNTLGKTAARRSVVKDFN